MLKCQEKIHGRVEGFLPAVNAVLHTPQELYTHHYVCLVVLPYDYSKSYYTLHINREAHHYISTDVLYD